VRISCDTWRGHRYVAPSMRGSDCPRIVNLTRKGVEYLCDADTAAALNRAIDFSAPPSTSDQLFDFGLPELENRLPNSNPTTSQQWPMLSPPPSLLHFTGIYNPLSSIVSQLIVFSDSPIHSNKHPEVVSGGRQKQRFSEPRANQPSMQKVKVCFQPILLSLRLCVENSNPILKRRIGGSSP